MSTNSIDTCAACGKEGGDSLKACTACHMVKYCNRDCQIAHRKQHKKACKKRAAELYDEKLFTKIEHEECPICMMPLPLQNHQSVFMSCCGKTICSGCIFAMKMGEGKDICPFCRMPPPSSDSDEEEMKRIQKLTDNKNAEAIHQLAGYYAEGGINELPQNWVKANELYLKAGELGCARGYFNLGNSYYHGRGVQMDKKKAKEYYELSAMNGYIHARHNLGVSEWEAGNYDRAVKHFLLSVKAGNDDSLENVKHIFKYGKNRAITKNEYANTLHAYQKIKDEMKSDERDKAAASGMFRN